MRRHVQEVAHRQHAALVRRLGAQLEHDADHGLRPERDGDERARREPALELGRDDVVEGAAEGAGAHEREDGGVAHATPPSSRRRGSALEAGGGAQRCGLVGALPREVVVVAAEVAVGGGLLVDRTPQVEIAQDRRRAQVEVLADEPLDDGRCRPSRCPRSRPSRRPGAPRRWRRRPGARSARRGRRRRRSWRRSGPRRRRSGRPCSGPCPRRRRRRAERRRRRCRRRSCGR